MRLWNQIVGENLPATQLIIDEWTSMVEQLPNGEVSNVDGVSAMFGNVEAAFLNVCTHDTKLSDTDELRARLRTAKELGSKCGHAWLFALCDQWAPDGWEAAVAAENLEVALTVTEMATDQLIPPRRSLPELGFRRTEDAETARQFAEVNALTYGMPVQMLECICDPTFWGERSIGYVGYLDGQPVTTAATFPVRGTATVGLVATHPDHQRKGYAEAVMRQAIKAGMDTFGTSITALHATEVGRPLYAAMGYEGDARFHMISEPHEEA